MSKDPKTRDADDDMGAQDWRSVTPFGAGLKRKRVAFVPASTGNEMVTSVNTSCTQKYTTDSSISDLYLSLVLPAGTRSNNSKNTFPCKPHSDLVLASKCKDKESTQGNGNAMDKDYCFYCETCKQDVNTDEKSHKLSIVHMTNESHSIGPHHLNRKSEGYKQMIGLGWDPEKRQGLGPLGGGIKYPIKVKEKRDVLGIGAKYEQNTTAAKKQNTLNAKQARAHEDSERIKRLHLHDYLSSV